jgi:PAB-dependent poly(A)-specific ribonuclease subunit 2
MSIIFKAIIIQVLSKEKCSHLVAIVKGNHLVPSVKFLHEPVLVPETEHAESLLSPWFVFNDFSVRNISEEEALSFPGKWKVWHLTYLRRSRL